MYGPDEFSRDISVSRETLAQLKEFVHLLLHWQKTLNLIGSTTVVDIWRRHILDSAQIFRFLNPPGCLVDLGSGAGFPGIVLAIMGYPAVKLIESNGKKCAFLRNASHSLEINVEVIQCRIEDYQPTKRAAYITSRALASLEKLLIYSGPLISRQGKCLFLKGANVIPELTKAKKNWNMNVQKHISMSNPRGIVLEIAELTSIDEIHKSN
ncbi:16S rRNA (guanine(527)-N(7))-methyltransferase RsmG [Rhodospirillales bacterium]|nr:16S rRNA (guanine(527)-N(7))-methyltransferase RsmG [Rhodospirillales bacterium]